MSNRHEWESPILLYLVRVHTTPLFDLGFFMFGAQ